MRHNNQYIRVTKEFTFDMAHALYGYDGPCKNIHGHTYILQITLIGKVIDAESNPKLGMVIDFTDFKKIVNVHIIEVFDHALVLNASTPHAEIEGLSKTFEKVLYMDYQPTCENLLVDFLNRIHDKFPEYINIHHIRLYETPTSFAEWFLEDNL